MLKLLKLLAIALKFKALLMAPLRDLATLVHLIKLKGRLILATSINMVKTFKQL
jgi:hypothetical protein